MNLRALHLFGILAFGAHSSVIAGSSSRPADDQVEELTHGAVLIGFEWIDSMDQKITLIRSNQKICAVKFLKSFTLQDGTSPSMFSSGGSTRKAEIEFSESSPSDSTNRLQWAPRRTTLSRGAMVGIGHWAWMRGSPALQCGEAKLIWLYPRGMAVVGGKVEVAPTGWESLSQIDLTHPRLAWYSLDSSSSKDWSRIFAKDLPGEAAEK